MKKIIISFIFVILLTSIASAEIIINQQFEETYNLGDVINIPVKITTLTDVSTLFTMRLICGGTETEIYKEYMFLSAGGEEERNPAMPLIRSFIGNSTGICKIKAILGENYILTNEFKISNLITLDATIEEVEFDPGEEISVKGNATKESGNEVNGFIKLELFSDDISENIIQLDTINNGFFSTTLPLPDDIKAGVYLLKLTAYEKDLQDEKTNEGFMNYNIEINQVPTNLEIVFENKEVEPGTSLRIKTILHDQTGGKIGASAIITIKDNEGVILEQTEKLTDEFLEFPIAYNEPPNEWIVVAVSNKLTAESTFKIKEKEDAKIEIINKTLIITNTGNVQYNKNFLVKIGEERRNINVSLKVDETQRYLLSAPDGEYQVEVISDGESKISRSVLLTGQAIDIKKLSQGVITLVRHPFIWVFVIMVLGFVIFIIFKKGYKRSFVGYIRSKKKEKGKPIILGQKSMIDTKNKAELSLSIKGDKQNVSLACIKIKNLKEIESKKSNSKEILQKIVDIAEENKAVIYENQDNLFFILAPTKTKTFKNERTAIEIAQKIKKILTEYNKISKQKIEFGISLNYGAIIAKQEKDVLKFMSMGTLITTAKKISSVSDKEIYLGENIKDKLSSGVKTERHKKDNIIVYTIKEIRDTEEHRKFIRDFLNRIEGKK